MDEYTLEKNKEIEELTVEKAELQSKVTEVEKQNETLTDEN